MDTARWNVFLAFGALDMSTGLFECLVNSFWSSCGKRRVQDVTEASLLLISRTNEVVPLARFPMSTHGCSSTLAPRSKGPDRPTAGWDNNVAVSALSNRVNHWKVFSSKVSLGN